MIFLDANAFYWYYGRDKLGIPSPQKVDEVALRRFLDMRKDKGLPSSVYMEIITHFRDYPEKLKSIILFIKTKDIKIYNNYQKCCVTPDELTCTLFMSNSEICKYANLTKTKKIDIEINFAVLFLETVRLLYLEFRKKNMPSLTEEQKGMISYYIGKQVNKENITKYKNEFTNILEKGYETNNEEKTLKDSYIDALNEECISINLLIELIMNYENKEVSLIELLQKKYAELIACGFDTDSPEKETMKNIVSELSSNLTYLNYSKERISQIFKKKKFASHQCEYIRDIMLTAWLERGQKLRKNDIFDMLCVGALDYKNSNNKCVLLDNTTYLLSFDKTMKKYLNQKSTCSYNLIKKFELENAR